MVRCAVIIVKLALLQKSWLNLIASGFSIGLGILIFFGAFGEVDIIVLEESTLGAVDVGKCDIVF